MDEVWTARRQDPRSGDARRTTPTTTSGRKPQRRRDGAGARQRHHHLGPGRAAACSTTTSWRTADDVVDALDQAARAKEVQGDRAAHRFARRHLSRRRRHGRRRRPRPLGRQAGDRLDGRRRGVGRLSRGGARRRDRGPARHHHRLDRRVRHLAGRLGAAEHRWASRSSGWRSAPMPACTRPSRRPPPAQSAAIIARARRDLCRLHAPGRRGAQARRAPGSMRRRAAASSPASTPRRAGLVDELGGLQLALNIAKAKAGIDEARPVRGPPLPRRDRPLAEGASTACCGWPASTPGVRRSARRARCARPWRASASPAGPATSACRRCRRSGARGERSSRLRAPSPSRRSSASSSTRPCIGRCWRSTMRATCSASAARSNRPRVMCGSNGSPPGVGLSAS